MSRPNMNGRGQALEGDRTTSGAMLISTLSRDARSNGRGIVRRGDPTTTCPKCGRQGVVAEGDPSTTWHGEPGALDGHLVSCGCPFGSNRIIAPLGPLSSSVSNSPAQSALTNPQRLNRDAEKKITQLYWSYGDGFTRLSGSSRHYVDLNLHAETENYQPGESISVTIEYPDGDTLINGARKMTLTGPTNTQGSVVFRNVFKNETLNLK